MIWLIAEIWVYLISAFLLGITLGWWIGRLSQGSSRSSGKRRKGGSPLVTEPKLVSASLEQEADDLTQIIGVDAESADRLNSFGIYFIDQIAGWSDANERWIEHRLRQPGRVTRERWVEQARGLAK